MRTLAQMAVVWLVSILLIGGGLLIFRQPSHRYPMQIVFVSQDVYQLDTDLAQNSVSHLTDLPEMLIYDTAPLPSPDGAWIAFSRHQHHDISYRGIVSRLNPAEPRLLPLHGEDGIAGNMLAWSSDSQWLYYTDLDGIYRLRVNSRAEPELLVEASYVDWISLSPDNRYLLFPLSQAYMMVMLDLVEFRWISIPYGAGKCYDWALDSQSVLCAYDGYIGITTLDGVRSASKHLGEGSAPAWSPDRQWIVYWVENELYRMRSDGSGSELLLTAPEAVILDNPYFDMRPRWSPDGDWLLLPEICVQGQSTTDCETYLYNLRDKSYAPIKVNMPRLLAGEIADSISYYGDYSEPPRPLEVGSPQFIPAFEQRWNKLMLLPVAGALFVVLVGYGTVKPKAAAVAGSRLRIPGSPVARLNPPA